MLSFRISMLSPTRASLKHASAQASAREPLGAKREFPQRNIFSRDAKRVLFGEAQGMDMDRWNCT